MAFEKGKEMASLRSLILQSPVVSSATVLLLVVVFVAYVLSRKRLNLPVVGKPGASFYGEEMLEGVSKVCSPTIHDTFYSFH